MLAAAIITAVATAALALIAVLQIRAGKQIAADSLEATKRQWQPRVSGHAWTGQVPGSRAPAPDQFELPYYLLNQGTGPAFNVEHGIEIDGERQPSGYSPDFSLAAGHEYPPVHDGGIPSGVQPLLLYTDRAKVETAKELVIWVRFENLLGESFEVRTFVNQQRRTEFQAI